MISWLETIAIVLTYTVAAAVQLCGAGAGEPFVTAAGVLGLMSVWRCFYTACEGLAFDFFSVPQNGCPVGCTLFCHVAQDTTILESTCGTADIDIWNWRTPGGARVDRDRDGAIFVEALRGASLLAICFGAAVWILYRRLLAGQACGVPHGCVLRCHVSARLHGDMPEHRWDPVLRCSVNEEAAEAALSLFWHR